MRQQLSPARDQKKARASLVFPEKPALTVFVSCWGEVCSRLLSVMLWSSSTAKMYCVRMCSCMQARLATMTLCSMCRLCNRPADHNSKELVVTSSKYLVQCFDGAASRRPILKAVSRNPERFPFAAGFVKE